MFWLDGLYFFDDVPLTATLANLALGLRLSRFGIGEAVSVMQSLDELTTAPQLSELDSLNLSDADNLESIAGIERWAESMT